MTIETLAKKLDAVLAATKEMLTIEEAANYIGVTKSHLYKLTSGKKIPFFKPQNKLVYFDKTELNNWLRQNPQKTIDQIKKEANDYVNRKLR